MKRLWSLFSWRGAIVGAVVILLGVGVWFVFFSGRDLTRQRHWSAQSAEPVGPLLYAHAGKTLISGGGDAIRLWDPRTERLKLTLPAPRALRLAVSPKGDILGSVRTYWPPRKPDVNTVEFWDLNTAKCLAAIDELVNAIALCPANPVAATTTGGPDGEAKLWSLPTGAPIATIPLAYGAGGLAFSPDGKSLAVGQAGYVEWFDIATLKPIRRFNGSADAYFSHIVFTPDGKVIVATCGTTGPPPSSGLWKWDLATGRTLKQIDFGHPMPDCSFSADGKMLAMRLSWHVMNRHDRIDVYDVECGRRTHSLSVRSPWMWSVAIAPDTRQLAVGFQPLDHKTTGTIGTWGVE